MTGKLSEKTQFSNQFITDHSGILQKKNDNFFTIIIYKKNE